MLLITSIFPVIIATRLKSKLENYGFKVKLTHEEGQISNNEKLEEYGYSGEDKKYIKEVLEELALAEENVKKHIEEKEIVKIIVVPNRIVNIVVK